MFETSFKRCLAKYRARLTNDFCANFTWRSLCRQKAANGGACIPASIPVVSRDVFSSGEFGRLYLPEDCRAARIVEEIAAIPHGYEKFPPEPFRLSLCRQTDVARRGSSRANNRKKKKNTTILASFSLVSPHFSPASPRPTHPLWCYTRHPPYEYCWIPAAVSSGQSCSWG